MKYRKLGNTGIEISAMGFGTMRLPVVDGVFDNIDIEKSKKIVRHAIDKGINYVDTAYPYHNEGNSEKALKEILADGYREKVYLGDKLSVWMCETYEDCEKMFESQLERTGSEYFDLYFLHSLDNNFWEKAKKLNVFKLFDKLLSQGKIKHIGFSFHGSYQLFEEVVNHYSWEFCIIQLNYMDMDYQAGVKGLEYAGKKGLGVLAMEPLKGGQLAKEPPENIKKIWESSSLNLTHAQRGLAYVLNREEVSCVLSGMNELEQLEENLELIDKLEIGAFNEKEIELYSKVKDEFTRLIQFPCTRCQYCMPCPFGVDIPSNIDYYNMGHIHNTLEHAMNFYNRPFFRQKRSTNCVGCGVCLEKCPQHLDIPNIMGTIAKNWAR